MRVIALFALLLLFTVPLNAEQAQGAPLPTWQRCELHLDYATMTHVTRMACHTYPIKHAPGTVTGTRQHTTYRSPHVRERVRYPTFQRPQPAGMVRWEFVTAYSYACGDVNGITADGSAPVPWYTVASNDPSLWHHTIYVPSLGFRGYVQDTGAPLDLFVASCGAAAVIGASTREVIVY